MTTDNITTPQSQQQQLADPVALFARIAQLEYRVAMLEAVVNRPVETPGPWWSYKITC